jgi:hypothetical protein
MYCPNCGTAIVGPFCSACGASAVINAGGAAAQTRPALALPRDLGSEETTRLVLGFCAMGLSAIILVTFWFPWVSIAGLGAITRALNLGSGGTTIVEIVRMCLQAIDRGGNEEQLLMCAIPFALQLLIPLVHGVYLLTALAKRRSAIALGMGASLLSTITVSILIVLIISANIYVSEETDGFISTLLRMQPAMFVILAASVLMRFGVLSRLGKLERKAREA